MDRLQIVWNGTPRTLPTENYTTSSSWTTQTSGTRQTKVQATPVGQQIPTPDGRIVVGSGTNKIGLANGWYLTQRIYTSGGSRRADYFKLYDPNDQLQFSIGGDVPAAQCYIFGARCTVDGVTWYGIYRDCTEPDGTTHYGQVLLLNSVLTSGQIIDPYTGDQFPPTPGGWGTWDRSSDHVQPSSTPANVLPIGSGVTVYKCDSSALQSFSEILWGRSEVLWRALWNKYTNLRFNPIGSIIHCAAMPSDFMPTGTSASGISIAGTYLTPIGGTLHTVSTQFVDVSYSLTMDEFYGDFMDYTNRRIILHMPFIGEVPVNPYYCVGGGITILYRCDIFNGNVCAFVTATNRWGGSETIKTATGNCAYSVPLTGHSDGMVEMLGSIIGVGALAVATGGETLALGGLNLDPDEHTTTVGSHAGNAAVCTNLALYAELIYDEPSQPDHYTALRGRPADIGGTVGSFTGFTIFSDIHADSISGATDEEKKQIETILKGGVYV